MPSESPAVGNNASASGISRSENAAQALYRISTLIGKTEEPQAALQTILAELASIFNASSGSIALLNPNTGNLEIEVQQRLPLAENDDLALHPGQGITGWVALQGKPLLVPDVTANPRYVCIRPSVRCEMAVPMLGTSQGIEESSQVLGVINLDSDTPGAFTPSDLHLFEQLAAEATAVIQRLWQLQQLRGKARQLEALLASGQALVSKLEEHELLEAVARDARHVLQALACGIYLYDPERHAVHLASLDNPQAPDKSSPRRGEEFPADACAIASALRTKHPVEFADIRSTCFIGVPDLPRDARLRSALVTPLVFENEVCGALAVFTGRVHRFDDDEKRLCSMLASIALVMLRNARLYTRVFQTEETLRKNEQLTTLGLLASEIAHEIRNPLTVIKLLFGHLGLDFPNGDQRRTDVRLIGEKLDQLDAIVSRVLNFAKTPAAIHARWPLAEIIGDTIALVRLKLAQSKIEIQFSPPPPSLAINAHKGQIQQVLLNILLNATQAMPDGGAIRIATAAMERAGTDCIAIDITDAGNGIPERLREKIFDDFLTGRPDGTGLGLAIAKRILSTHNGDIELASTGPGGTTMRIVLPLAHA